MEDKQRVLALFKMPVSYDRDGQMIIDSEGNPLADIRGFGLMISGTKDLKKASEIQDALGEMIATAFNLTYTKDL